MMCALSCRSVILFCNITLCNAILIKGTIKRYLKVYYVRCMVPVALITRLFRGGCSKKSNLNKLQQIILSEE